MSDDLEPPRPEPDFRVFVVRPTNAITTDVTHAVMDVYDIAVNSLDFGSGFLSTEEVGNLRALGKAIGAERFDYQHDKCLRCGHDHARHWGVAGQCGSHSPEECSCDAFIRSA